MRNHRIFYFSTNDQHVKLFNTWAKNNHNCPVLEIDREASSQWKVEDLPVLISQQKEIDSLYVIIDYLSLFTNSEELEDAANIVRRTILQFPEVDFLFDQSGVPESWISGVEFVLERSRESALANKIVQGFHIFNKRAPNPFFFASLDYDNLFDGTNLRWAVRRVHYDKLNVKQENFKKLQEQRSKTLAYVIDDEPRQSRFNSFALYASGFRVIPVHTSRMLMLLNDNLEKNKDHVIASILRPSLIVRDFDLQFPDAREHKDYKKNASARCSYVFENVPLLDCNGSIISNQVMVSKQESYDKMIDYIRNYRYHEEDKCHWKMADSEESTCFWGKEMKRIATYVITNGHDDMKVSSTKKYQMIHASKDGGKMEASGLLKPVSGLYHPFFTALIDNNRKRCVEENFIQTRYSESDISSYEIDKRRANHNHGVPIDIYDTVNEMLQRSERYYREQHFIKSAVLAQETIELLNGFHLQMMIRAYHIKAISENAIAMDVVGADEDKLVLDALLRKEIVKQDVQRMVFPLFKRRSLKEQYRRRQKEHQILEHIYSDCRKACHENEYFDAESVYISAMAHLDEHDYGLEDFNRYCKHLKILRIRK